MNRSLSLHEMIPQEKTAAVSNALQQVFGLTEIEGIERLTKGLSSALIFRIIVRGSAYLLRIITSTDAVADPTRQFACMEPAAEAGIAPHIWYTSVEDRISITGFVEAVPLPEKDALLRIPATLRTLHALPSFSKELNYTTMGGFIRRFGSAGILPRCETEEFMAGYAKVAAVYPRNESDMVSSHNDLKPENILFDGARAWLIDWEAAFLNDRYFDLAIVANFVVWNDADEIAYLHAYFGCAPDEYQRARFFLMRQAMHMFFAAMFLYLGAAGKPLDPITDKPEFEDFHRRMWAGDISLAGSEMKVAYGRVHWDQLSQNLRQPRFEESLKAVADPHASAGQKCPLLRV